MTLRKHLLPALSIISLAVSLPVTTQAQEITGPARAVDGDSLEMTGTRIRLFGIDAPEAQQTCQRGAQNWACGQEAASIMAELVEGKQVSCQAQDTDPYGRLVSVCTADRLDLAQVMIDAGLAVALPQFSERYVAAEARAREQRTGIWGSTFVMPADYRSANPRAEPPKRVAEQAAQRTPARPAQTRAPVHSGCNIKGNRNRRGQWIYHLPGMPYYDATRPEEIFCSEAAAQAAGYRRAIVR